MYTTVAVSPPEPIGYRSGSASYSGHSRKPTEVTLPPHPQRGPVTYIQVRRDDGVVVFVKLACHRQLIRALTPQCLHGYNPPQDAILLWNDVVIDPRRTPNQLGMPSRPDQPVLLRFLRPGQQAAEQQAQQARQAPEVQQGQQVQQIVEQVQGGGQVGHVSTPQSRDYSVGRSGPRMTPQVGHCVESPAPNPDGPIRILPPLSPAPPESPTAAGAGVTMESWYWDASDTQEYVVSPPPPPVALNARLNTQSDLFPAPYSDSPRQMPSPGLRLSPPIYDVEPPASASGVKAFSARTISPNLMPSTPTRALPTTTSTPRVAQVTTPRVGTPRSPKFELVKSPASRRPGSPDPWSGMAAKHPPPAPDTLRKTLVKSPGQSPSKHKKPAGFVKSEAERINRMDSTDDGFAPQSAGKKEAPAPPAAVMKSPGPVGPRLKRPVPPGTSPRFIKTAAPPGTDGRVRGA
eukprot:Hpha_TRINITY_DN16252_c0_g9::TRINITY_DN16252_c0_g9_i1::g.14978::m.14978